MKRQHNTTYRIKRLQRDKKRQLDFFCTRSNYVYMMLYLKNLQLKKLQKFQKFPIFFFALTQKYL